MPGRVVQTSFRPTEMPKVKTDEMEQLVNQLLATQSLGPEMHAALSKAFIAVRLNDGLANSRQAVRAFHELAGRALAHRLDLVPLWLDLQGPSVGGSK